MLLNIFVSIDVSISSPLTIHCHLDSFPVISLKLYVQDYSGSLGYQIHGALVWPYLIQTFVWIWYSWPIYTLWSAFAFDSHDMIIWYYGYIFTWGYSMTDLLLLLTLLLICKWAPQNRGQNETEEKGISFQIGKWQV